MTALRNLTPHPIVVQTLDATLVLPASGESPRITEQRQPTAPLILDDITVPVWTITPGAVTDLPEPQPDTWLIVSRPVATAAPDRTDLLIPYDTRRDADGNVIACRSLASIATPKADGSPEQGMPS